MAYTRTRARAGIRQQPLPDQRRVIVARLGRVLLVLGAVLRPPQPFGQRAGRAHSGTWTVDRVKAREGEPGLVPEKHQVRLDGQALLHHPLDVVHDAVERAVGQHQHLDPLQLADRAQGQQLGLDLAQRHTAVHRELMERVGVQVGHLGSGQHQPVMVGLVAVTVDQNDVAGGDEGLGDDLVRGRRAVGDEVRPAGTERLGGQLLRLPQRAGGFEQRVEPAARGRGLGQEDVQAVEADHVTDPVRADDRVALRDGQRVEHARRAVAVMTQGLEERRAVSLPHARQDAQVQLQRAFLSVEDAAEVVAEMPGRFLDRDLRHQVQVELGAQPGQPPRQDLRALIEGLAGQITGNIAIGKVRQAGEVVAGRGVKPAADHAGLQVRVQPRGDNSVLGAADHDQFVAEVIARPAPAADLLAQGMLLRRSQRLDQEHLEVRPARGGLLGGRGQGAGPLIVAIRLGPLLAGAVGLRDQGPVDPGHRPRELVIAGRGEQVPGVPAGFRAWEGPVPLDGGEDVEHGGDRRSEAIGRRLTAERGVRQLLARFFQPGPGVRAELPPAVVRSRAGLLHHAAPSNSARRDRVWPITVRTPPDRIVTPGRAEGNRCARSFTEASARGLV